MKIHSTLCGLTITLLISTTSIAQTVSNEIYCVMRENGAALSCQWVGKDQKSMTAEDIASFIDQAAVGAYITVRSKKNFDRTFATDPNAPQFKKLAEVKRRSSISEISRAKSELFSELEKRMIKLSDELDNAASGAELIKYDPSIGSDKLKRDFKPLMTELEGFRKNQDKACTSTPAFEQMTRTNSQLQSALSKIIVGFQAPGTCLSEYRVFRDKNGAVDLRQLNDLPTKYAELCKK